MVETFRNLIEQWAGGSGFVYLVEAVGLYRVKIGKSNDPEARIGTLQTSSPVDLRRIAVLRGGDRLESCLHSEFAREHIRGEWFAITPRVREFLNLAWDEEKRQRLSPDGAWPRQKAQASICDPRWVPAEDVKRYGDDVAKRCAGPDGRISVEEFLALVQRGWSGFADLSWGHISRSAGAR